MYIVHIPYHVVDKTLDSIVVTDIYLVEIDGIVDVGPHVMIVLDMVVKSIGTTLKFMAGETADKAYGFLVFLRSVLAWREKI